MGDMLKGRNSAQLVKQYNLYFMDERTRRRHDRHFAPAFRAEHYETLCASRDVGVFFGPTTSVDDHRIQH